MQKAHTITQPPKRAREETHRCHCNIADEMTFAIFQSKHAPCRVGGEKKTASALVANGVIEFDFAHAVCAVHADMSAFHADLSANCCFGDDGAAL